MKKRMLALLLLFVMLLSSLSACTKSQTPDTNSTQATLSAKYAYKAETIPVSLPEGVDSLYQLTQLGDRLLGVYSVYTEENSQNMLCQISLDNGSVTPLDWYQPPAPKEGYETSSYISLLRPDRSGNIWIVDTAENHLFNLPADFNEQTDDPYEYYEDGGSEKRVCCYSPEGKLLNTVSLPEELREAELISIDEKNQLYYTDWENAYVLSTEGKILKTIPLSSASLTDFCGRPAIETYGETFTTRLIDPETLELGEEVKHPINAGQMMPSNKEGYDFFYVSSNNLYGYTIQTDTSDLIVDWMDLDIDPAYIESTVALSDGRFVGFYHTYDQPEAETSLVILTEVDPSSIQPKTTLRLACMYLDYNLRARIIDFNKNSDSIHIIVNDYSQYATEDDYYAGLTKLNTEIMAGQVPDLFVSAGLPISQYITSGVIEPLNGFFETDETLSMDDLMPQIVNAACVDGKLYEAFPSFHIETVIALKRVAEHYPTWDLAAVQDAMQMLQENASVFSVGYTRGEVLNQCVGRSINRFVDWQSGTCSFDSPEFKDLLNFCAQFPEEFDWETFDWNSYGSTYDAMRNGQQLMLPQTIYSTSDYLWMLAAIQEEIAFVGYPGQSGGSSFQADTGICISTGCSRKDAAWSFLRTFFTEEYQMKNIVESSSGMPTNRAAFNQMLEKAMQPEYQTDENGEPILDENNQKIIIPKTTYYVDETTQYEIDVLSQQQADALMALMDSITTMSGSNDAVFDIIEEESGAFFEGQRSVDDVAAMIQNRVGLYVAEQR